MKRFKYGYTDDGFGGGRFLTLIEDEKGPVVLYKDAKAKIAELQSLSVTKILLDIVPGDGSGQEVYAKSVADVEAALSKLGHIIEEMQSLATTCPGHGRSECVSCCWPKVEAPAPVQTCQIGIYGRAYDGPEVTRAYTYRHQPDNVGASKLGQACYHAIQKPGGDSIDLGLGLLKHLQDAGFGVFEVKP